MKKILRKISTKLHKLKIYYYKHILSNYKLNSKCKINMPTLFNTFKGSNIQIADDVILGFFPSPYFYNSYNHIDIRHGGGCYIKSKTVINNNFCLIANKCDIVIEENCFIGTNFKALNSDFHGLLVKDRNNEQAIKNADINIGKNCFIGDNVTVLKGVSLGQNCVVAAGSVVTKSFAKNSLIAGNPAKFIREIENEV